MMTERYVVASAPYKRVFAKWLTGERLTPEEEQVLAAGGTARVGYEVPVSLVPPFNRKRPRTTDGPP